MQPCRKLTKHLLGYWATVVETYTQWLAAETYRGRGALTNSPRFANGDEACDLMIKEGSRLVLIEIKASILTAKAKYSFDADVLRDELLRKALHGDEGERKGIAQLHHAIQRFHDGEPIEGLKSRDISIIYPVIVFMDRGFTSPYLGTLYQEHFDRTMFPRKPVTTAPYAITLADLESVLPYTHHHDLTEIIDDYHRNNRTAAGTMALGRFAYSNIPLLRNKARGRDIVHDRFAQFHDDLISNVFPQSLVASDAAASRPSHEFHQDD